MTLESIPLPVIVRSGAHVVGDFTAEIASGAINVGEVTTNISGQPVMVSGQPVDVGSGIHIVGDFPIVESGLHVIVGSGVIGDFTISSGLYVVQGKTAQLQDYFISDVDESDTGIKFYGYLDIDGSWYIMQDTSGTTYRYASSGIYASNWIDRSGIIYQTFNQEF